jgi:hypothetical protein
MHMNAHAHILHYSLHLSALLHTFAYIHRFLHTHRHINSAETFASVCPPRACLHNTYTYTHLHTVHKRLPLSATRVRAHTQDEAQGIPDTEFIACKLMVEEIKQFERQMTQTQTQTHAQTTGKNEYSEGGYRCSDTNSLYSTDMNRDSAGENKHSQYDNGYSDTSGLYNTDNNRFDSADHNINTEGKHRYSADTDNYSAGRNEYSESPRMYSGNNNLYSAQSDGHIAGPRLHSGTTNRYSDVIDMYSRSRNENSNNDKYTYRTQKAQPKMNKFSQIMDEITQKIKLEDKLKLLKQGQRNLFTLLTNKFGQHLSHHRPSSATNPPMNDFKGHDSRQIHTHDGWEILTDKQYAKIWRKQHNLSERKAYIYRATAYFDEDIRRVFAAISDISNRYHCVSVCMYVCIIYKYAYT